MNPLALRTRRVRPATVVVVDDEPSIHSVLGRFLGTKGHEVRSVSSVDDAVELLQRETVDVVILDVRMPRRSGLDVLRFMREDGRLRRVPVLILTGAQLSPDERAMISSHGVPIFHKPDSLATLGDSIACLMGEPSSDLDDPSGR